MTMSGSLSPTRVELVFGFEADNGLVQQDMVQHRTERVVSLLV